jgi:hypothetical protein
LKKAALFIAERLFFISGNLLGPSMEPDASSNTTKFGCGIAAIKTRRLINILGMRSDNVGFIYTGHSIL